MKEDGSGSKTYYVRDAGGTLLSVYTATYNYYDFTESYYKNGQQVAISSDSYGYPYGISNDNSPNGEDPVGVVLTFSSTNNTRPSISNIHLEAGEKMKISFYNRFFKENMCCDLAKTNKYLSEFLLFSQNLSYLFFC